MSGIGKVVSKVFNYAQRGAKIYAPTVFGTGQEVMAKAYKGAITTKNPFKGQFWQDVWTGTKEAGKAAEKHALAAQKRHGSFWKSSIEGIKTIPNIVDKINPIMSAKTVFVNVIIIHSYSVNKSLTVYTSLPDQNDAINNVDEILETLVKKHSVVLIDCDFNTPIGYFKQSQETYLVQSMDILTIQPLTAFLRELKAKNVLDEKKLRIILNKMVRVRGITEKTIIGGMAYYNDPAMSYMTELFDRTLIKYIAIPFEEEVYTKYLEAIINCDVNLKGYTKTFMQVLKELGNMIYPLVSGKSTYRPPSANVNSRRTGGFSPSINNTLDQMKRKY